MLFWTCIFKLYFWRLNSRYFDRVLLMNYYFHLYYNDTDFKTYAVNEYSNFHLVLLSNSLFVYQVTFCVVIRIHFKQMLFWKCMFILCFWCPDSHYFEWVLLTNYYFHLCCYDTYCKTYAAHKYSYFCLVLLLNSLFFYPV